MSCPRARVQLAHAAHDRLRIVTLREGLLPSPTTAIRVRADTGKLGSVAALKQPRAHANAQARLGRLRFDDHDVARLTNRTQHRLVGSVDVALVDKADVDTRQTQLARRPRAFSNLRPLART